MLIADAKDFIPMTSAKLSVNGTEYTLPEVDGVTLQFALRDDLVHGNLHPLQQAWIDVRVRDLPFRPDRVLSALQGN